MSTENETAAVGQDHGGEVNQTRSEYSGRSPQSIVDALRQDIDYTPYRTCLKCDSPVLDSTYCAACLAAFREEALGR